MKAKFALLVAAPALMLLMAACSSTAHIEKDDNTDFSHYKTFAWADDEKDRSRTNDMAEQRVKNAVGKELEKTAGWRESKHRPDVILSYDVLVENTTREISNPVYSRPFSRVIYNPVSRRYSTIFYPSQFIGYDRDERPTKEGTITISMLDTKTDKVVWQGWTTDEVNSRNLTTREIQNSVRAIFKKFDVAKN